jgi:SAM-dependent methyltransferase
MTPPVESKPNADLVIRHAWGYAQPLFIEAAVRQKLFDHLVAGPKDVAALAQATGASVRGLRMLCDALVGMELLTKDDQGRYALTPESDAFLVSTKPSYLGAFYAHVSDQLLPKWLQLNEAVRTGRPVRAVNQEGEGAPFFAEFVEALFPMGWPAASALAEHLGVARATQPVSVLDLAAGSGVWSIALAKAGPTVQVTAVDWPGVLPVTQRVAERHSVADRFRYVAGDLDSADLGTGHHIATLGHILHSEGEARSKALLQRTAQAMASGGTIAIAEWLVNADRRGPMAGLIFAVNMLVHTDQGDTFSFEEIAAWLKEAGFKDARLLEVPAVSPLILATRA